jgi:hypothetical protein
MKGKIMLYEEMRKSIRTNPSHGDYDNLGEHRSFDLKAKPMTKRKLHPPVLAFQ